MSPEPPRQAVVARPTRPSREPRVERPHVPLRGAQPRPYYPPGRSRSRATRGRACHQRAGGDPCRCGERQDPGHQPAGGVRDCDRGRARGPGAGRHVHGQGGHRDGGAAALTRPPGRDGAHVPRPCPQSASTLLAGNPRRGAAARPPRLEAADRVPARSPAPRPLPVHAVQGPGRRDRVGEGATDRSEGL